MGVVHQDLIDQFVPRVNRSVPVGLDPVKDLRRAVALYDQPGRRQSRVDSPDPVNRRDVE